MGGRRTRRGDREREPGEGEVAAHSVKALRRRRRRRPQDVRLSAFECLCVSQVILALAILVRAEMETEKRNLDSWKDGKTKLEIRMLLGSMWLWVELWRAKGAVDRGRWFSKKWKRNDGICRGLFTMASAGN